jgi:hypothetical protein
MQMNYKIIFVADGNATNTDAEHNATLNNMVRLFADVMTPRSSSDSSDRPRPHAKRPSRHCFEGLAGGRPSAPKGQRVGA